MTPALTERRRLLIDYADEYCTNEIERQAFFDSFEIMEKVMRADPALHAIAKANRDSLRGVVDS